MPAPPLPQDKFTAKQVCIALGVPRGSLNWWIHQGLLRPADTVAGKAREFELFDVVVLAIMKQLTEIGVDARLATNWAYLALGCFDANPEVREYSVYFTPNGEEVFPEIRGMQPPANALWRLTIYPTATMDDMKARLRATTEATPTRKRRTRT